MAVGPARTLVKSRIRRPFSGGGIPDTGVSFSFPFSKVDLSRTWDDTANVNVGVEDAILQVGHKAHRTDRATDIPRAVQAGFENKNVALSS